MTSAMWDMEFSTGPRFLKGPRLIDGQDLNVMVERVNLLSGRVLDGRVFDVRDFGAVGDGIADDTLPLQAASAAAVEVATNHYVHPTIYMPRGKYRVTDTPFSFDGPVTPNIVGEQAYTSMIVIDPSFPNKDVIYIRNSTNFYTGLLIAGFAVIPTSWNGLPDTDLPGRYVINFDMDDQTLNEVVIERLVIREFGTAVGGRSIRSHANPGQGGGIAYTTIHDCWLSSVELSNVGDLIAIRDNVIANFRNGATTVVWNQTGGAHGFLLDHNAIVGRTGCARCDGGTSPVISFNEFESGGTGVSPSPHNAIIEITGNVAVVTHAAVIGNSISSLPGTGDQLCLFLGNGAVQTVEVTHNRMSMATDTRPIVISINAPDALIGWNHYTIGAAATATLLVSGAINNNETVTIDGKVYTFQTVLTNVDGHVLISGINGSIANLRNAMNLTGNAGVDYAAATTLHPTVAGLLSSSIALVVKAKTSGTAGNAITVSDTMANGVWESGPTLSGGTIGGTRSYNPAASIPGANTQFQRTNSMRLMLDADLALNPSDRTILQGVALTAPRTATLPYAKDLPSGTTLEFIDTGLITGVNTITVSCRHGDTFSDGSVFKLLNAARMGGNAISNGSGIWLWKPFTTS